jgi:DNA-binding response OmpR family regulator
MHVLIVEDDARTADFIRQAFKEQHINADWLRDGDEALAAVLAASFEAVVLDIMLPGRDGLSVVRQLRARGNHTPVLLLSARGEVAERVEGLEAGADDYLGKPFALAELVARVRALGRRGSDLKQTVVRLADLTLDTAARIAQRGGHRIELTSREYRLLEYLMRSAGRVCTRMMIFEQVWDYQFDPGSNLVDVYVRKLRQKVDAPFAAKLLHSVRGEGYVMKALEEP